MINISRRSLVSTTGTLLCGTVFAHRAFVQVLNSQPPIVDTTNIKEIAKGIFVIGDRRVWLVPNIGIILGNEAALVVDTGLGPVNGEAVLAVARRIAGPYRRLLITLTHFHPEHGYGLQAFCHDATIVYNRAQRDELVEKGEKYLALFRQTQSNDVRSALDGTILVLPHVVYDGPNFEIDLGGRKVELQTYGLAHTRGDQTIFLPAERILFTGDLIEKRAAAISSCHLPINSEIDSKRWASVLRNFRAFNPTVIVPGHGDLGDIRVANDMAIDIELMQELT